jgi:hypothetical protein
VTDLSKAVDDGRTMGVDVTAPPEHGASGTTELGSAGPRAADTSASPLGLRRISSLLRGRQ